MVRGSVLESPRGQVKFPTSKLFKAAPDKHFLPVPKTKNPVFPVKDQKTCFQFFMDQKDQVFISNDHFYPVLL
jgi:hypothetical protein